MNILILGEGPVEEAWAHALAGHAEHRLWAACPGLKAFPHLPGGQDLDDALATAGLDAVIVGGDPALRAEGLRRAAAAGLAVICLHPPGPNADPYYQIALSRQETGALVIPDLPARLHPGVEAIAAAIRDGVLGPFRELRYEVPVANASAEEDLAGIHFPTVVDVVRRLVGEIETTNATGDPLGARPTESLVVQLRGAQGRRAEVRLQAGSSDTARLTLAGAEGTIALEHDPGFLGTSTITRQIRGGPPEIEVLPAWDRHAVLLDMLMRATKTGESPRLNLLDGTRAMEVAEATVRSLRRGRTVDLLYEEMSEEGNFKSVMTGVGCGMLLAALGLYCVVLAARAFGFGWAVYLAWAIPPVFFLFLILQLFRFAIRKS